MTSEADRQRLLQIARDAIVAHVEGASAPVPVELPVPDRARAHRAARSSPSIIRASCAAVSGISRRTSRSRRVVRECAVAACSADPRFPPVSPGELAGLDIEVSLLGPLEPVAIARRYRSRAHGLVVEQDWQRGLLLPQVATEWQWDRETFLAQTCHKAGLPRDAWKRGAKVWRFEAEVFGETAPPRRTRGRRRSAERLPLCPPCPLWWRRSSRARR